MRRGAGGDVRDAGHHGPHPGEGTQEEVPPPRRRQLRWRPLGRPLRRAPSSEAAPSPPIKAENQPPKAIEIREGRLKRSLRRLFGLPPAPPLAAIGLCGLDETREDVSRPRGKTSLQTTDCGSGQRAALSAGASPTSPSPKDSRPIHSRKLIRSLSQ